MICEKKSYAKINLSLRIIRKKRNGYHILKSLMSLIDFYDEITFEECDDIKVETDPFVCEEKDNLCYKIAEYMKQYSKVEKGIKIKIIKNIPSGGGLGGGSSNAACVLTFLNEYWNINFSEKKLMKVAFLFGADIPFFVKGKQSYVGGCGEKVKPIKKEIERDIIIIIPAFNLSTREVFQNLDINGIKNRKNKKIIFPENIYNDMEESANALADNKIEEFKQKISKICDGRVLMSGSGSTLVYYVGVNEDKDIMYNKIKELLSECKVILSKLITE